MIAEPIKTFIARVAVWEASACNHPRLLFGFLFMKEINLTKGYITIVDDDDYEYLNQWKWIATVSRSNNVYARRVQVTNRKRVLITMHRLIMRCPDDMVVDHKDGNGLNNTKVNLRICTRSQNSQNRNSSKNSSSKYLGVSLHKSHSNGKTYCYWKAEIRAPNGYKYLGIFKDEASAALAYNKEASKMYGEYANLNIIS